MQFNKTNFFTFKNNLICEHFIQKIPKLNCEKIMSTYNVNFIEKEIDSKMNKEIDQYLKDNNLKNANVKITKLNQEKFYNAIINRGCKIICLLSIVTKESTYFIGLI